MSVALSGKQWSGLNGTPFVGAGEGCELLTFTLKKSQPLPAATKDQAWSAPVNPVAFSARASARVFAG